MSLAEDLKQWLKKMEYKGDLPEDFGPVCGPSTAHIWQQIMLKVKPRGEVQECKKNLIVNRLQHKSLTQQDSCNFSIKEIDIYMKKKELEKKLQCLKNELQEKESMLDEISLKNKRLYIMKEHKKKKLEVDKMRIFLLNKKIEMFKKDKDNLTQTSFIANNVITEQENENYNMIKLIKERAAKIEKMIKESPLPIKIKTLDQISASMASFSFYKTPNPSRSVLKYSSEINCRSLNIKSRRCINFQSISNMTEQTNEIKKSNKRESLGILPKEYLDSLEDEADDEFLMPEDNNIINSTLLNRQHSDESTSSDFIKEMLNNQMLSEDKKLYRSSSRNSLLNEWENIYDKLLFEAKSLLIQSIHEPEREVTRDVLTELYFLHIKNEMEREKYQLLIKEKNKDIVTRWDEILIASSHLNTHSVEHDMQRILKLQTEEVALNANCAYIKKIINNDQENKEQELEKVLYDIKKTNNDIHVKRSVINFRIDNIRKIIQCIEDNREEVFTNLSCLVNYANDLSWTKPLLHKVFSNEINVFKTFPIGFNNRSQRTTPSVIPPAFINIDSDALEMIVRLIDAPFMTSEDVLLQLLQDRAKLIALSSVEDKSTTLKFKKYSLADLREAEKNNKLDELEVQIKSLMMSPEVQKVLSTAVHMAKVGELYREMFVKNYISEKRLVENRPYSYYESKLLSFVRD